MTGRLDVRCPVIYLGPSLRREEAAAVVPSGIFLPPAGRGDLYRDREAGASIFVLVDGVFAHQLAISPREVADVLRDGAVVIGASSMGALRAAECWPLGMRGVGAIYRLFRSGCLTTDDEVAVTIDAEAGYAAVSVALVNVRYALSVATRRNVLDRAAAERVLDHAVRLHFSERRWPTILRQAGLDAGGDIRRFCETQDLKKRDALRAMVFAARLLRDESAAGTLRARISSARFEPTARVRPERLLGRTLDEAQSELARWLFGSGRYQRFIWPCLVARPDLCATGQGLVEAQPSRAREALASTLARLLPDVRELGAALWHELAFCDELESEYVRMHAVRTLAASARARELVVPTPIERRAHALVAIEHGAPSWSELERHVEQGRLFGAIPFEWIRASAADVAHARAWRA